jgi:hypothetical protein
MPDQDKKPQTRKIVLMVCANPGCRKEFELDRQRRSLFQQGKQTVFFCSRFCVKSVAQGKPRKSSSSKALLRPAKPKGRPRNVIVVNCANPTCGKEIELDYYGCFRYRKGQSQFWCSKDCKNCSKVSQRNKDEGKRVKSATEPLITSLSITTTTVNPVSSELSQAGTETPVEVDVDVNVVFEIPEQPVTEILELIRERPRKGHGRVRVTVNCANPKCGKEFELNAQKRWAYRKGKRQFLCSKECYTSYQTNWQPITVSCSGCGIEFELDKYQYPHYVKGGRTIFYHDKECYLNREVTPPRARVLSRPVVCCVGCGKEFELNVYQASQNRKGIQGNFYHSKQCFFDNRVLGSMAELRTNSPYSKDKIPWATCGLCGKKFEPVYTQRKRVSVGIAVYCCVSHSQGRG